MIRYRLARAVVLIVALVVGGLATPLQARAAQDCFAETSHCIEGRFLDYWRANGGLAINGYPLSGERRELLEDGNEYTVQYFERVRLEYHPENAPPYDVLLGQFGRRTLRDSIGDPQSFQATVAPTTPRPGRVYFPETGHNLGGRFLDHWQQNGGLAQFGFPLAEEFEEYLPEGGQRYTVQYFERARFEWHPDNPAPYDVLLGQFGRDMLAQADRLTGRFGALYITDEQVRSRLGPPVGHAVETFGAIQEFERGRMIARQIQDDGPDLIAVLCGDAQGGRVLLTGRLGTAFPDTWNPGQPEGGGPGPRPGLYEPRRGFGVVWRDGIGQPGSVRVRDCLGYATGPEETSYRLVAQDFARGVLLSDLDGLAIYVLWREAVPDVGVFGHFERIAPP